MEDLVATFVATFDLWAGTQGTELLHVLGPLVFELSDLVRVVCGEVAGFGAVAAQVVEFPG